MSTQMLQRIKTRCVHFTGIQHDTCKAGVEYETLPRDPKPTSGVIGLPCINPACGGCDKRRLPTDAEAKAEVDEMERAMEQFVERLGNGQCPHCGAVVTERVQVGKCVYAEPCGHRIGQGRA